MQRLLLSTALLFTACTQAASSEQETGPGGGKADGPTTTETITAVDDAELPSIALAEDVKQLSGADANGKLLTVYQGGIVAPFVTYAVVFDPEPQEGGDYGSFKTFQVSGGMKDYPADAKLERRADNLILTYSADFATFDDEGNEGSVTKTVTAKFAVDADGALAASGTVTY